MRSSISRSIVKMTLIPAALFAVCLWANTANAQSAFQGRFTLPFAAHWGATVLPPGDYLLSDESNNIPGLFVVREANSRRLVAYESASMFSHDISGGKSALLIATRGTQHVVYSLRLAEHGRAFVFDRALAQASAAEEARQVKVVLTLVAKK